MRVPMHQLDQQEPFAAFFGSEGSVFGFVTEGHSAHLFFIRWRAIRAELAHSVQTSWLLDLLSALHADYHVSVRGRWYGHGP